MAPRALRTAGVPRLGGGTLVGHPGRRRGKDRIGNHGGREHPADRRIPPREPESANSTDSRPASEPSCGAAGRTRRWLRSRRRRQGGRTGGCYGESAVPPRGSRIVAWPRARVAVHGEPRSSRHRPWSGQSSKPAIGLGPLLGDHELDRGGAGPLPIVDDRRQREDAGLVWREGQRRANAGDHRHAVQQQRAKRRLEWAR